jgi:hypothetical protein
MIRTNRGFTLIELVMGLSLSVVIVVILLAAMRLAYKSQAKGAEKIDTSQKIRLLGDRVSWLIRGIYPFIDRKEEEGKLFFEGESDRIGFVTTSVDIYGTGPEDMAGLKWVSIFADSEGLKIREKVFFLEDVFDDKGGNTYLLAPGTVKLKFEYYDIPEGEKRGDWISDWDPDEKKNVPAAVKFLITVEHEKKIVALPEIIVRVNAR